MQTLQHHVGTQQKCLHEHLQSAVLLNIHISVVLEAEQEQ